MLSSFFFRETDGIKPIAKLKPKKNERVFNRSFNDPFYNTNLHEELGKCSISSLAVCGFSLNHCVDAAVRRASDIGYRFCLIKDATGCFERRNFQGQLIAAEHIAESVLANLDTEYASLFSLEEFLAL